MSRFSVTWTSAMFATESVFGIAVAVVVVV